MFPRLVYKSAAVHKAVNDADEHAEALADGWFASVPEAHAKKANAAPAPVVSKPEAKASKQVKANTKSPWE